MKLRSVTIYNCLTVIVAVILTIASGYYYYFPRAKMEAPVRTVTAEKGETLVRVSATGRISATK